MHIGWVSKVHKVLYLMPTITLGVVSEALRKTEGSLNLRSTALWRQCQDRGYLRRGLSLETFSVTASSNSSR